MMRFSCLSRARKDMIEQLLRRGRLADIQMLNFFGAQVEKEVAVAAAATAAATAATATSSTNTSTVSSEKPAEAAPALLSMDATITQLAEKEKQSLFSGFEAQCYKVRAQAMTQGPLAWMGEVFGTTEWSTAHLSHKTVKATHVIGDKARVTLSGRTTAAGSGAALPASVQVVVRTPKPTAAEGGEKEAVGTAHPAFLVVSVPLNQEAGKVDAKLVNGLLQLTFNGAMGRIMTENVATTNAKSEPLSTVYRDPLQLAARQHVMTAAAYSGLLAKIEEIAALHVTTAVRYDGLLVRNSAAQMRLSQLACFRYGVESLTRFVAGDGEVDSDDVQFLKNRIMLDTFSKANSDAASSGQGDKDTATMEDLKLNYLDIIRNNRQRLYELPLLESVVLNIYAENALMDGLDCAWHIVRDYPLTEKVPHRSRPDKLIDYPYLNTLFNTPKYSIASADGSMELQTLEFLSPLLRRGGSAGATGTSSSSSSSSSSSVNGGVIQGLVNTVQELVGLTTAGRMRLTAPHVNLKVAAQTVEEDLHSLMAFIDRERLSPRSTSGADDPSFAFCVSNYVAELFTNIAVLYRCTAALTADEEGLGHREWLLAQCFTAASNARRRAYLDDFRLMRAASKAVGVEEQYATHPLELMNASPRTTVSEGTSSSAAAGKKAPLQKKA